MKDHAKLNRIKGCLVGMAIGDAVGVHHEFKTRKEVKPITTYTEGNPYSIPLGYWTDDTSMALCIANSLLEKNGFDADDIMKKFQLWWKKGYMSSTGECFDIGGTIRQALMEFLRDPSQGPYRGLTDVMSAGNGCIMRLAPIPIFYNNNIVDAISYAEKSSRITHGYVDCIDGTRLLSEIIYRLLNDQPIFNVFNDGEFQKTVITIQDKLSPRIMDIVNGSFFTKTEDQISGQGGVINTLEACLWAMASTNNFREAILKVINLGEDADTTGAITGQMAGAYYGYNAIDQDLKDGLYDHDMIVKTAESLYEVSLNLQNA